MEIKPYRCPTPGCEQAFERDYQLKDHFKNNKVCRDFKNNILKLAKKGVRL